MALGMEKTHSAHTEEHITPRARAQRLVLETHTTCPRGRGHATIRRTAGRRRNWTRSVRSNLSNSAAPTRVPRRRLLAVLSQLSPSPMPVSVAGIPSCVALDPDPGRFTTLRFTLRLPRNCRARIAQIKNWNTCARWQRQRQGEESTSRLRLCARARVRATINVFLGTEVGSGPCCFRRNLGYQAVVCRYGRVKQTRQIIRFFRVAMGAGRLGGKGTWNAVRLAREMTLRYRIGEMDGFGQLGRRRLIIFCFFLLFYGMMCIDTLVL